MVTMRSLRLLVFTLFLITVPSPWRALATREGTSKVILGGWTPIKDINDPHVQEIAEFAVSEHNKQANTSLVLSRVVEGETQVVAGTNYRLVIETKDGEATEDYVAMVWEKPWEGFRSLTSFKPL